VVQRLVTPSDVGR